MALTGYEELNIENWDSYGGKPITPEVLHRAQRLAGLLAKPFDDAPGGDGSIGFEWRQGDDILFLDIGPGKTIALYGKIGGESFSIGRP